MNQNAPWWGRYLLAASALAMLGAAIGAAWAMTEKQLAGNLSMALATLAATAVGYFYTSSAGSERKDDTIAAQGAALATSTPVPPAPAPTNPQP